MRLIDADALRRQFAGEDDFKSIAESIYDGIFVSAIDTALTINPYEWISIEDDKPKKNGYYLCWRMTSRCGGKEYWQIDKLYWEDNLWLMHHNTFKTADYVTHWIPLPAPPTEKEN